MQRDSTKLRNVEQLSLLPERKKITSAAVDLNHVPLLRSTKEALEYACRLADVVPKEVYPYMDCDKTTWSRICSGEWDLDGRDIHRFSKVVGNNAYPLYIVHEHGYDLHSLRAAQDNKDRRIAELEKTVADQERAMRMWVEAQKGRQ